MTIGHNSDDGGRLKSLIERIERLEEEKRGIASDIGEVYAEAKDAGYDVKAVRLLVRERRMDERQRADLRDVLNIYRHALGMLADTPLGEAAMTLARTGATVEVRTGR